MRGTSSSRLSTASTETNAALICASSFASQLSELREPAFSRRREESSLRLPNSCALERPKKLGRLGGTSDRG
eukprot:CAMPEP_0185839078 /NCGR_PEP_ID=MMETSP1353-20130828/13997_1 /TAXON_ID=1077150 /ORGANISM="Erythrolobus australicus, Strain CCMP3124" /LENGTH=71 /DNA_ID=CAMNT_0028538195 /DNA_START=70 /DNA_END=281 /DNA_ORIENTATION=+